MGEHSIIEIAEALDAGIHVRDITFIAGTVYKTRMLDEAVDTIVLPSYEKLKEDKLWYARSFIHSTVIPTHLPESGLRSLTESIFILCRIRQQSHLRRWKWMMSMHCLIKEPGIRPTMPGRRFLAISEVKFSLVSNRGCFGGCSFCALTFHQGRIIQTRGHESIIKEAKQMTEDKDFKGYIHDVGGPTANFRHPACEKQLKRACARTNNVCFQSRARICGQTTKII